MAGRKPPSTTASNAVKNATSAGGCGSALPLKYRNNVRLVKQTSFLLRAGLSSGTVVDMDSRAPPAFVQLMQAKGYPALEALSKEIGDPGLLAKLFARKERSMRTNKLGLLAGLLETPMDDLARLMGLAHAQDSPVMIRSGLPVSYAAQAGYFVEEDETRDAEAVTMMPWGPDPRYRARQWLEEVRGDSVDRIAPDGSIVQVADWLDLGFDQPRTGQVVIVRRTRAQGALRERSIKVAHRVGDTIELRPDSSNPRWQSPLLLSEGDDEVTVEIAGLVIWVHRPLATQRRE